MKLLTYQTENSAARLGFMHEGRVIDMANFGEAVQFKLPSTMLELIDLGDEVIPEINALIAKIDYFDLEGLTFSLDEVTLLAPIPKPRKNIIGIGLNYTEHVAESARTLDT